MADQDPSASFGQEVKTPMNQWDARKKWFRILGLTVALAAMIAFAWYLIFKSGRISTDNAYVGAGVADVTPAVDGIVSELKVMNTNVVKAGDVLVTLDDDDARIQVAEARAALRMAEQKYRQSVANVTSGQAQVSARGSDIAQAQARLAEAQSNYVRASKELERRQALAASGAVSGEELSTARAAADSARAAIAEARAGVEMARATQASAGGDLAAVTALVRGTTIDTAPEILAARARLEKAEIDLKRTVIRAPIDGVVINKTVAMGQHVAPGKMLMQIVPSDQLYVDANFKESQLDKVRIGQPVEMISDYYGSDIVYHGKVYGFAGGTGSAFAIIPAQNATGNWVKVVQRLPVRVLLDPKELKANPLRVGLSMEVTIDTRGD